METVNDALNKQIPIAEGLLELETSYNGTVSAGFPSETFNYTEEGIDFNKLLVKHKETIFAKTDNVLSESLFEISLFAGIILKFNTGIKGFFR